MKPRDMLILHGRSARLAREQGNTNAYEALIQLIDETTASWKDAQPDLFWDPADPRYKALTTKWSEQREARYAANARA